MRYSLIIALPGLLICAAANARQTATANVHPADAMHTNLPLAGSGAGLGTVWLVKVVPANRLYQLSQTVVLPSNYPWLDLTGVVTQAAPLPAAPAEAKIMPQDTVAGEPVTGDVNYVSGCRQIPNGYRCDH